MRYFSMFSGCGGFELGIHRGFEEKKKQLWQKNQEGIREREHKSKAERYEGVGNSSTELQQYIINSGNRQPNCVGVSEIDKFANKVLRKRFPEVKNYGNATTINTDELPDFDCLVGGFPCQAFSLAGKRRGFDDTRGTLFFEIARILQAKRPKIAVLENVKGLLSHDQGKTFRVIIETLNELGYDVQWMVLNSKFFGVPQNRERVFIIASLRGERRPEILPFRESDEEGVGVVGEDVSYAIDADYSKGTNTLEKGRWQLINQLNNPVHSGNRVYGDDGVAPTLNTAQGGNRQPKIVAMRGRNPTNPSDGTVGAPAVQRLEPNTQGTSNTLTNVQKDNLVLNEARIRRLTPVECERLQGFPDGWTKYGLEEDGTKVEMSDTQRYKMMGNAVTVNVIEAIFSKVLQ